MKNKLIPFFKNRGFSLIVLFFILTTSAFFYHQKVFSFHFVDEEDNFILGMYLTQGEKLYGDLFSHHQPLAYILSAGIQEMSHPQDIYKLIRSHRHIMIAWSVIWPVILTIRFGWVGVFFAFFYEYSKIYLLGNLFLSESLVVYPVVYLVSWTLLVRKKVLKYEYLFLGFCLSLSFFLLAPIWPLIILLTIWIIKNSWIEKKNIYLLLLGALPIILISAYFSDIPQYFYNVFYINYTYYLPISSDGSLFINIFKSFFAPIISFLPPLATTQTGNLIRVFSLILLVQYYFLFKQKKYFLIFISFLILGLSNIRYISPGSQEYQGFHLLIWYANLIIITASLLPLLLKKGRELVRSLMYILFFVAFFLTLYYASNSLFKIDDQNKVAYINYSRQYDYGQAIKGIAKPEDTLFVVPDEWLIYSQSGVKNASYMVNYYAWMTYVPSIHSDIDQMFRDNPPTFFYCDCGVGYFGLEKYFSKYTRLKKEAGNSKLYVLPEKLKTLTPEQKNTLRFFGLSYE